ncbi:hypothetical protein COCC4DRAFT_166050 [Bipolaris maydis ATCC 48331]|uniref:SUI1 domain-containing protein n=2 Tax=Cochliobolus heterostrophus TaxID=5016 RepID=M2UI74_COCH5|nr:uncharacterized protein COCC4DRAFT_166050 [Bipolaris maydis ATCC 48331]EMD87647.1 hypothetical protein COCHEDRAFT_1145539 [Bipolaris maydis C5]ENI06846.1 hypothetical protein COCC4DRAFT_166050 [Bipolaris maydis ATCC 48331]KAJ5023093.1 hypothetical protein J3E73DRAFT_217649 [Bipolaris maydis]KAJ6211960.1 eukaryotic translation initiation factor SUI1 family protein [Bipolaris maydis]
MFKKKPNIKPLAPLKSSDRRRTADQIIADFAIDTPADDAAALTALRRSILPDNAQSARFTTTAGPDLSTVTGTLYVGAHDDGDQRVLWLKLRDRLYPTVYTLWHNPAILPLLHTPLFVVDKLRQGADLMTPGLQRGPPFPRHATKGAIVAIASLEAPSVPMAVGECIVDVSALGSTQGAKGHAVSTIHWAGDELWSWSATGKPGRNPPDAIDGWDADASHDASLADRAAAIHLDGDDDQDGGIPLGTTPADPSPPETQDAVQGEDAPSNPDFIDTLDDKELTTKEIDDAFKNAFLFGVRYHMDHNKQHPTYGLEFPLSQSHVMSQLVQPFLPTYTPARTASLQIKKTSWKNLRKFLKYLDKQLIIKSKDRDGNEVVVLDIDFKDRQLESFVPYRLPKKDGPTATSTNDKAAPPPSADPSLGQKLKLVSVLRPKEKLAPILAASKADTRGLYTPAELKQILLAYVEAENLIDQKNKRLVRINPQLADALLGSSAADNAALSSGAMPRDALAERMLAAASPLHAILRNDASIADTKPKAGAPPKIQIILETRSGNKTVTKVHGLESYYIPPQPLADELRKTCAGSTSIDKLQGSSPKAPVMEVMVQGPQKDAIIKALEKRGVNKNWVDVVDKTKGKKK